MIAPGTRQTVDLPVSVLSDHTPVSMSVHVIHGKADGPTMFVSAGIHGDEVIGVEIVRRLLRTPHLKSLRGTLIVIPILNAFGFINHARYLPDRRDLNRMFPGTPGSLLRIFHGRGDVVASGDLMAVVCDPFGENEQEITAPFDGIVVGRAVLPVVNEGDAIIHLARVQSMKRAEDAVGDLNDQLSDDPLFDEDEII
ncbi:hypothetical protein DT23_14575 [Thioclava indica]|uniref:Succinylglutamate desuccinylase/Aspartoacylase catalytic domain-containing protein n=1 Tax=Thioclava indica TaxID=1353528 RepID=A0A074JX34_9RHOB|nr:hypothetical protein DT23_14575 [Thioclava indica]